MSPHHGRPVKEEDEEKEKERKRGIFSSQFLWHFLLESSSQSANRGGMRHVSPGNVLIDSFLRVMDRFSWFNSDEATEIGSEPISGKMAPSRVSAILSAEENRSETDHSSREINGVVSSNATRIARIIQSHKQKKNQRKKTQKNSWITIAKLPPNGCLWPAPIRRHSSAERLPPQLETWLQIKLDIHQKSIAGNGCYDQRSSSTIA